MPKVWGKFGRVASLNLLNYMRKTLLILLLILIAVPIVMILQVYTVFPSKLMLLEGEEYTYNVDTPITIAAQVDKSGVLSFNGEIIQDRYSFNLKSPLTIKSEELGNFNVDLTLFGIIPFRSVNVNVIPKTSVIPCGNTVGVKLYTDGVLVIGVSSVNGIDGKEYAPWKDAGIKEGDVIESISSIKVKDIEHLIEIIEMSQGNELSVVIRRKGEKIKTKVMPKKCSEDKTFKIGLWVRDSTAGIGTLTFYDPNSKHFGALGHGITDADTGELLTVGTGSILKSSVISVRKGEKGKPGELKGIFMQQEDSLGEITENTTCGIFGKLYTDVDHEFMKPMPIGLRSQVKEGKAYILSNVNGEQIDKFEIEIQKVLKQNAQSSKGMIIKITDRKLLDITGGIVQGMSGSPIIQDDKVIGAVTHVFVNDPTRGYGIFIDWMLNKTTNLAKKTG